MAIGDVYEVTDVQTLQDQQVLNVYFYRQEAAFVPVSGSIAQNVAEEFNEVVLPAIAQTQANDLLHVETRVRNLFDDVDSGLAVSGVNGTFGTSPEYLPSFAAWGLTLSHDNSAVRPGGKRIAGVAEIAQIDGVPTASVLSDLAALGDVLAAPFTGGLIIVDDIMFPIVVQRVREGAPGSYTYRLPETPGELVFGNIIEAIVKAWVTSQISRKFGIGL